MDDFDVEVGALRSDAKVWDKAAQDLAGPIAAIRPLVLDSDDLTALDGFVGLTATYEKARSGMSDLMTQATKYFEVIANALIAVAAEYERMERTNEHGFRRHERELGGNR